MRQNPKSRNPSRKALSAVAFGGFLLLLLVPVVAWQGRTRDDAARYPTMAPLDQYLMDRDAEIALARSAAPPSISADAEVLVLGKHGYETAVAGKNGFVCMVERSWAHEIDSPEFWNPKMRAPNCFNAPAARSYLRMAIKRAELVLAGRTKEEMSEAVSAALDKKELPAIEPGAVSYMMSKQGHLNDGAGHWHPHVMFLVPATDPEASGAGLPGSPIFGAKIASERLTIFFVPVGKWSDGTPDRPDGH
jgi:hypothetical protein